MECVVIVSGLIDGDFKEYGYFDIGSSKYKFFVVSRFAITEK